MCIPSMYVYKIHEHFDKERYKCYIKKNNIYSFLGQHG